jgi:hypothetical protein
MGQQTDRPMDSAAPRAVGASLTGRRLDGDSISISAGGLGSSRPIASDTGIESAGTHRSRLFVESLSTTTRQP